MNLRSLLNRYSVDQLKEALRLRSAYGRTQALEEKKTALLKQVAKIDRKLAKLNGGNGADTDSRLGKQGRKKGYKLSAATRRKMSEAAKRRYASKGNTEAPSAGKKKRKPMSAETRAKMAAAAKARWAKVKGPGVPETEA